MSDESLDDMIAKLDKTIAEGPAAREAAEAERKRGKKSDDKSGKKTGGATKDEDRDKGTGRDKGRDRDKGGDKGKDEPKSEAKEDRGRRSTSSTDIEWAGDGDAAPSAAVGGPRRRVVGVLATVLGVIGCLLAIAGGFLMLRLLFGASGAVDRLMDPIDTAVGRMETRIDETDDLIDGQAISPDKVSELRARIDGLVDLTTGANQGIERVEDHPLYGLLPADTGGLSAAIDDFATAAAEIDDQLGSAENGDDVPSGTAGAIGEQVDGMQSRVTEVRGLVASTESSLAGWIRLGSFLGFLGALWSLWAQFCLARRGIRGVRGRAV